MVSLEDKLLGNKIHNYCSSSEDEAECDSDEERTASTLVASKNVSGVDLEQGSTLKEPTKWAGQSANTGPKGVIKDWQRFKQLETEQRAYQEQERLNLIKTLSITCNSAKDEEHNKEQDDLDAEFEELMNDDFLLEFQKQRMKEMLQMSSNNPKFGSCQVLNSREEFLDAIDDENKTVTIIVHIYENNIKACKTMNSCLNTLATEYFNIKFCKIIGSIAGLSKSFKILGIPALLVYKAGQLIGNFVRISDDLGEEFSATDVEDFLIEHGLLIDKYCVPKIIADETKNA